MVLLKYNRVGIYKSFEVLSDLTEEGVIETPRVPFGPDFSRGSGVGL